MNRVATHERVKSVAELIELLAESDSSPRVSARYELVRRGDRAVTQALIAELNDPLPHVRWEAAKALGAIADPMTAHSLLHALDDDDQDVRWVASEGLISLGKIGLLTVLSGVTRWAQSTGFCRAAHHVLHVLRDRDPECAEAIDPVLVALDSSDPGVLAPPAAHRALSALKRG
jgi:hypothetical protein